MTLSPCTALQSGVEHWIARRFATHLVELPGDVVQLYIRDPASNLVELDQHGAARLPDDMRAELKPLWELNPQSEENMRGRLFVPD